MPTREIESQSNHSAWTLPDIALSVFHGSNLPFTRRFDSETTTTSPVLENDVKICKLIDEWCRDTKYHSSPHSKMSHPAFTKMKTYGIAAIPPILKKYSKASVYLYLVLEEITGKNPVPSQYSGNSEAIRSAWISWGQSYEWATNPPFIRSFSSTRSESEELERDEPGD